MNTSDIKSTLTNIASLLKIKEDIDTMGWKGFHDKKKERYVKNN